MDTADVPNEKISLAWLILLLIVALVAVVAMVAARPDSVDPFDPPAVAPTPAPSDWLTPGRPLRHVAVTPVSKRRVPALPIRLPDAPVPDWLKPTADGGCLAVSVASSAAAPSPAPAVAGQARVTVRVIRFQADGSVLWDRRHAIGQGSGYLQSGCIFTDGSLAIGLQIHYEAGVPARPDSTDLTDPSGMLSESGARLLRFSAGGSLLWTAESSLTTAGSLDHLFARADGSLLSAGVIADEPGGTGSDSPRSRISVQRFGPDGSRLGQRLLLPPSAAGPGGDGSGSTVHPILQDAAWSEGAGLVLAWRIDVADAAVAGEASFHGDGLTALSDKLEQKWSIQLPVKMSVNSVSALPGSSGILAIGMSSDAGRTPSAGASQATRSLLFHLTNQGAIDWQHEATVPGAWLLEPVRLTYGQFVVGQYQVQDDGSETTALHQLSANGAHTGLVLETPGRIEQMVPTIGGGFTCVLRQAARALPQPPQISALWRDTEAIVCQFNNRMQLVWRRTIDQYKYALRGDVIVVTAHDRLLVG